MKIKGTEQHRGWMVSLC